MQELYKIIDPIMKDTRTTSNLSNSMDMGH